MKKALGIITALALFGLMMGGFAWAGALEPTAPPGPTMKTLDEIYDKIMERCPGTTEYQAGVPRSGQETSYATGDDGDLEKGVALPSPRFTDNGDGTVTDNLTGLIWLKNANAFGTKSWADALTACNTLNSGEAGLTDGSAEGDWRLPSVKELCSLIDLGRYTPALPAGHPFTNVQSDYYWSSTTNAYNADGAWDVSLAVGYLSGAGKPIAYYVWCVRGGPN